MKSIAKNRNIAVCILLTIITCGIYGLYWFIAITDETNDASGYGGTSGIVSLLLSIITCNIYGWYWAYKMGEKVDAIRKTDGREGSNSSVLYLILQALGLGIVVYAIVQDELNKIAAN